MVSLNMNGPALNVDDDDVMHDLIHRERALTGQGPGIEKRQVAYGSVEAARCGLTPFGDAVPDGDLIHPDDFKEVIELCHAKKLFPIYHIQALGEKMSPWNQNGLNYCWAWGITGGMMAQLAAMLGAENVPALAPVSLGWTVNWRNAGNYLTDAIQAATTKGVAPLELVDHQHSRSPSRYKTGWDRARLHFRLTETFDVNITRDEIYVLRQILTILATGTPGYMAHNWWMHALMDVAFRWNPNVRNKVEIGKYNSHNDGLIWMSGSRAIADEWYGLRAMPIPGDWRRDARQASSLILAG